MKRLFQSLTILAVFAFFATAFTIGNETVTYSVDTEKSSVAWKGYKVAGSHEGAVRIQSGSLEFTDGLLTGGAFEIDMASMTCTDLPKGVGKKLIGHLQSEDFFGTTAHPTASFKITSVLPQGVNRYKVLGDLTIKEITKAIKFIATTATEESVVTANADIQVDRSDFNVKYGSGTFFGNLGDKTIYDEFDLNVSLVTVAK